MGSSNLIVGVLGKGDIAIKTVKALLADRVSGQSPRFVLPVTDEHWTPVVRAVAQWALAREHPYELVLDGSEQDIEAIGEIIEGAAATHRVAAIETKLVGLLAEAEDDDTEAALLLAWDNDDDACQRALNRAVKRDVKAYDLTDGLNDLTFEDAPATPDPVVAEAEPEPPAEETYQEEPKPKRTRRTKAQMEEARAATAAPVVDSGPIQLTMTADEAQAEISSNGNGHTEEHTPMYLLGLAMFDLMEEAAMKGAITALKLVAAESQ